jgi:hypothetical protein
LRHGEEEEVLSELRRLAQQEHIGQELIEEKLQYLTKRREMIHYKEFADAGYPIGSGCVESAKGISSNSRSPLA